MRRSITIQSILLLLTAAACSDRLQEGPYKDWFDQNILWSYFESDYPWTRLGYTYDWSGGDSEYGLTEFLVPGGSGTEIAFTCTTDELVLWLEEQQSET